MNEIIQKILVWLENPLFVRAIVVLVGIVILAVMVRILRNSWFTRIKDLDNRHRARKLASFIKYLLIIILIAIVYSDQLSGLGVALGAAGVGVAFALQEVIVSFAGWLAIMFGGFYRTGDRVQLGGIKGDVIDIGVLRTTIMEAGQWVDGDLYNGRIVRVANSFVFKEPVFNYSADFPFLWDEIKITIQFGCNYKRAKSLLEQITHDIVGNYVDTAQKSWEEMLRKYLIEPASTKPKITMVITDQGIVLTVRYAVEYKKRRGTKDQLFEAIIEAFMATKGDILFAVPSMQLVSDPRATFNIQLKQDEA